MIYRIFLPIVVVCLIIAAPILSQELPSPIDWIPADFAAYISIDTENRISSLDSINVGLFIASILQPSRVSISTRVGFGEVIPLDALDIEAPSFDELFGSWLEREIILAYRELEPSFQTELPLMIIPTSDPFAATAGLAPVIQGQDHLTQEIDGAARIYHGDHVTIAFMPTAVLIGSQDDVRAALETQAGRLPSIADDDTYQAVTGALPQNAAITLFAHNDTAANAVNFFLNSGRSAQLISAFGTALSEVYEPTLEAAIAAGGVDAVGAAFLPVNTTSNRAYVTVVFHTAQDDFSGNHPFETDLLRFIPRNALIVHNGADLDQAAYGSLVGLSLSNFIGAALSAFPFDESAASFNDLLAQPSSESIRDAIDSVLSQLESTANFDLEHDLLRHLDESYSIVIIPRPNNPVPMLNTPYEVLLVAQANSPAEALDGINTLITALDDSERLEEETLGDVETLVWRDEDSRAPIFRAAAAGDILLVGIGDSVEAALSAGAGDNQLISQRRWSEANEVGFPYWYFDVNAIYNLVAPPSGGRPQSPVRYVAITGEELGNGLYQLDLTIVLNFSQ